MIPALIFAAQRFDHLGRRMQVVLKIQRSILGRVSESGRSHEGAEAALLLRRNL